MDEKLLNSHMEKLSTELKLKKSSDKTISIYSYFVKRFLLQLESSPERATEDDVKKFLANIIDSYNTKSYALLLSSLRFFFKRVVKRPVMIDIETPKIEKEIKDVLSKEEVERLIEAAPTKKSKLIIGFMYSTGLRVSELVSLSKKNLDLEDAQGVVKKGKGKKDRTFYFSKGLVSPFREYLSTIQGDMVFPGWKGKHMDPRNVQNLLERLRVKTGITKRVSPHTLRRSFATHLHDDGYDIKYIQELLGHSRVDTTERYIDVSSKQLKKIKNPYDSLNIKL